MESQNTQPVTAEFAGTMQKVQAGVNPQKENGHIRIANEVWLALARTKMSNYERRVLDCIIYRTWGYNLKSVEIRNKQMVKDTGIPHHKITETLKKLLKRNLCTQIGTKLSFNKIYTTWKNPVPKQVLVPKQVQQCTQIGTSMYPDRYEITDGLNTSSQDISSNQQKKERILYDCTIKVSESMVKKRLPSVTDTDLNNAYIEISAWLTDKKKEKVITTTRVINWLKRDHVPDPNKRQPGEKLDAYLVRTGTGFRTLN